MVDDNDINLSVYANALRGLGNNDCIPFTSSRDALEWTRENTADVVLLDYNMPELDGLSFIQAFRSVQKHRDVPIVMITGLSDREIRYRALELGAADFLTKPVDVIEFRARMKNMFTISEHRMALANRAVWLAAEVDRATASIVSRERETINRLMRAAEFRDNETGMHIVRMGRFSAAIAANLGLDEAECELLQMATPMHDIGKVATPDRVLLKPGKLDAEEWAVMKRHTLTGYDILKDSESALLQKAAEIALSHHEKFDGTGYPYGWAGERIPLSARICAVSDVFDALTSVRPYKAAWPLESAIEEIERGRSRHFDPKLVDAFRSALPQILEIRQRYSDEIETTLASG